MQSDSIVAFALTQRLSNTTPASALNFLGAELGVVCEGTGVEHIAASVHTICRDLFVVDFYTQAS